MPTNDGFQGVSNCYVFKSQLQEYAQKVGIATPVYETTKEGPSHEPSFKSTVIVNDVRYDSLLGFSNRKLAEQSAAEVALVELAKSSDVNQSISQPIHETGLCKNLLQEYAQKMSYAIPLYQCEREETPGRAPLFSCTVDIGGIRYVGAAAKTKKEAEIKVARTALLAIRSSKSESSMEAVGNTQLTVLPSKKRQTESDNKSEETAKVPKAKKAGFKKKKKPKKKLSGNMVDQTQVQNLGNFEVNMDSSELSGFRLKKEISGWVANASVKPVAVEVTANSQTQVENGGNFEGNMGSSELSGFRPISRWVANASVNPMAANAASNSHDLMPHAIQTEYQKSAWEHGLVPHVNDAGAKNGQSTSSSFNHGYNGTLDVGAFSQANDVNATGQSAASHVSHGGNGSVDTAAFPLSYGNMVPMATEVNLVSGSGAAVSVANNVDTAAFPLSYGNMAPMAKEVNLVSGSGAAVSVANNSGVPYSEASSVVAGQNLP